MSLDRSGERIALRQVSVGRADYVWSLGVLATE